MVKSSFPAEALSKRSTERSTIWRWAARRRCSSAPPSSSKKASTMDGSPAGGRLSPRPQRTQACRLLLEIPRWSRKARATDSSSTRQASDLVPDGVELSADRARPGDKVLLSGSIGDHGIAILAQREGLKSRTKIQSDSAALHTLVDQMLGVQLPTSLATFAACAIPRAAASPAR